MDFGRKPIYTVPLLMLCLWLLTACAVGVESEVPAAPPAAPAAVEAVAEPTVAPMNTATAAPAAETAPAAAPAEPSAAGPRTFTIVQDRSEVRFVIDEVLRGQPTTVAGANKLVTGEVLIDPANPALSQIGTISVDAGGFVTDNNQRNGAIRNFILVPSRYPTITFTPTAISGLPASVAAGESVAFQVTGHLTVLAATNPVTFDLTVTAVSEDEISVSGRTTIARGDYGVTIPRVPFVANVGDEVVLELDLVAVAAQ